MEWIPKGPDFVFHPRDMNYKRLSLYNEKGLQGRVVSIVIDPTNQHIIYALDRPVETKGITIFRKREDSLKWDAITDTLRDIDPSIDPNCIAINPVNTSIIYVGTFNNSKVYRGEVTIETNGTPCVTWGPGSSVGFEIRKLLVDSRQAIQNHSPSSTHLFAASQSGIYYSEDDGSSWRIILQADVTSMIGYFPSADMSISHIYGGCNAKGVYYTDSIYHNLDPNPDSTNGLTRHWIPLSTGGNMLPAYLTSTAEPRGNFDVILMDHSPLNPDRIYVWLFKERRPREHITAGLYTTADARNGWTQVVRDPTMLPQPYQDLANAVFAVAPNPPGNANRDILYFGREGLLRSTDGGMTWSPQNKDFYADMYAIAFFPHNTNPADVYIGCDGGIAYCHHFTDHSFPVDPIDDRPSSDPSRTRFNQGDRIDRRDGQFRNLNHGRPSSIIYSYSSHPEISALEYTACQDTGISASSGTSCWRGINPSDSYQIVVAPGLDGIRICATTGMYDETRYGWPNLKLTVFTDKGYFRTVPFWPRLPSNGSHLFVTSNLAELDKKCLSACYALESDTNRRLNQPIQNITDPAIEQQAYPSSMSGIDVGSQLVFDDRTENFEEVTVTNIGQDPGPTGARWFRAIFKKPHNMNAPIRLVKSVVVRVDINTLDYTNDPPSVTQLGQDFGLISNPNPEIRRVNRIGVSQNPAHRDKICCATVDKKLWIYDSAVNRWDEVLAPRSLPSSFIIHSITINNDGDIYWLLKNPIPLNTSNGSITTPLFKFARSQEADPQLGQWEPQFLQFTSPLPTGDTEYDYRKLVCHPQRPDIIFLSYWMKILKLTRSKGIGPGSPRTDGWQCEDISFNLPKQPINDLWIGEIKHSEGRNVLLRGVLSTRGVWEADISQTGTGAVGPQSILYMRDNILDHGWLNRSPPLTSSLTDRISNPYRPALYYWHYQCPDIKLDLRQQPTQGNMGAPYYQIDPEAPLPFYQTDPGPPSRMRDPPEISYHMFERIKDKSQELLELSDAWLHIQIHNYGNLESNDVYVWPIFCNAAAGVPCLNARSGMPGNNTFNFWNEIFNNPPGTISHNNLPSDSRWRSIGEPRTLSGIKADNPKVASWKWRIPQLSPGNLGHYCIVAFIHSRSSPIRETHTDVGVIVGRNRQIAQKNLQIISVRR